MTTDDDHGEPEAGGIEVGGDATARASFARDVARLMNAAAKAPAKSTSPFAAMRVEQGPLDGVGHVGFRWQALPERPAGVELSVELGQVAVGVRVTADGLSWSHDEVLAGDPQDDDDGHAVKEALDDSLDLVAAVLWGRVVVQVHRVGGRASKAVVRCADERRSVLVDTVESTESSAGARSSGGVVAWVQRLLSPGMWRPEIIEHRNAAPRPASMRVGPLGHSPTAPWAGTLTAGRDAAHVTEVVVDGVLDLHSYRPKQVAPVVREYIAACRDKGITELRIIHGKGIGNLRRTVHSLLEKHDAVAEFQLGGHGAGSWGATLVTLHPRD